MEDVDKFQQWLDQMLTDARKKLDMSDRTMCYVLMHKGLDLFMKCFSEGRCQNKNKKNAQS